MGIANKIKGFASKHKKGLAVAGGLVGLGGLAYGAKKLLGRRGGRYPVKRGSVSRLKTAIQRLRLKTLKIKEQKKLFKEQMKV